MCVRNVDDQGVLQFTLIHAVGCVLHRRASRAIRRLQLFRVFVISTSSASVSSLGSGEESEEGKVRENSHIPGGPRRDSLMRARRRARKAPGEPHTDSNGVLSKKNFRKPPTLSNPEWSRPGVQGARPFSLRAAFGSFDASGTDRGRSK